MFKDFAGVTGLHLLCYPKRQFQAPAVSPTCDPSYLDRTYSSARIPQAPRQRHPRSTECPGTLVPCGNSSVPDSPPPAAAAARSWPCAGRRDGAAAGRAGAAAAPEVRPAGAASSRARCRAPLPCSCLRHDTARRCFPPSLSLDGTVPAFLLRDEEDLRVREEEEGTAAARQRLPSLLRRCLRASAEGPGQATPRGRQRRPDAFLTVGAEQEEDAESPWDSEVTQADSEMSRKLPCGVLLPAAERHGACSQFVSGESDNGLLEKPNKTQLKTPISALEINEMSPENKQQKSDLLQEFDLEDVEDIEETRRSRKDAGPLHGCSRASSGWSCDVWGGSEEKLLAACRGDHGTPRPAQEDLYYFEEIYICPVDSVGRSYSSL
ncbi:uncharacterized protein LOC135305512 [Passer domesticus]|uniref:uncharacterized protein LOC135305512 n=1 Tax=Passer domesticus TaxID=48849 RepID=UPI0030FE6302